MYIKFLAFNIGLSLSFFCLERLSNSKIQQFIFFWHSVIQENNGRLIPGNS